MSRYDDPPFGPREFRGLALALAESEGPADGLAGTVDIIQKFAPECVPDLPRARKAFDAWGIPYEEGGEPIHQMVSSQKTLKVALPTGWTFTRRGGGGHVELLDERGASRIRWHVHPWDPVSLDVNERFSIRRHVDLSATEAVVQIFDGPTVIHTVPYRYPHARINDPHSDGTPFYKSGYPGEDEGWTKEMGAANYLAQSEAGEKARAWLDENRPGWNDPITSWSL